ncbi:MAG TPA: NFACT family protein [Armatimonadota bacterium]|nr:NFACT family protein [Armatimonadota bacterium]
MNYDSFCLAAAVEELRDTCLGAFVDQVYQPEPRLVLLAFTGGGPRRQWLFSSDARWPRAHATAERRANPPSPPGFCMLLRKHLSGARLAEVEQVRFDRILRLTFRRGEETRALMHEIMGRHSNLMLLDEAGTVLGAVKTVPPSESRVRPVLPGRPYAEPPGARPDPRALSLEDLRALLEGVAEPEEITRRLSGWGTFAAREAFAAGPPLPEAVFDRMERVRRARFEPVVFLSGPGSREPKGVWAFASRQPGWTEAERTRSISVACDEFYGYRERTAETEARRKTALSAVERALRTATLQRSEAEAALDGLEGAELLRIQGELLSASASQVERGAEAVELPNWYDPEGGTLRIRLDPELDGRANAERYFHRYRRAAAAAEAALQRIPELDRRLEALRGLEARVRSAEAPALEGLLVEVRSLGLLREVAAGAKPEKAAAEFPSGVRVRRVPVGNWELLYGENATSNDYLSTRGSRPGDLWLHARAVNGAHVVIRNVGSLDRLPPEVLREAARIAAAHSEAKHASVVAVDYTFRRFVRKPRGSAPGAVLYTHEKTLHVEPRAG